MVILRSSCKIALTFDRRARADEVRDERFAVTPLLEFPSGCPREFLFLRWISQNRIPSLPKFSVFGNFYLGLTSNGEIKVRYM